MDQRGKESTSEREFEDDCYVHIVLFTAGIAVLMACFKRVLMAVFLFEEWRSWVFVVLNLILLAILIISSLSTPKETNKSNNNVDEKEKKKKDIERNKKVKRQSSKICSEPVAHYSLSEDNNTHNDCHEKISVCDETLSLAKNVAKDDDQVSCREEDRLEASRLSKEELNERAEAFIVMFRQHLVLDARKCWKH